MLEAIRRILAFPFFLGAKLWLYFIQLGYKKQELKKMRKESKENDQKNLVRQSF